MKKTIISKGIASTAFAAMLLGFAACSDVLEEQPRSAYDPTFFSTEKGVKGGITSMYSHLRYIYGQGYYYNSCETGTDEYTYAQSADGNFKDADMSGVGNITPSTSRTDAIWGAAFSNINTCNGVIENAEPVGIDPSLVAEARFFRAFDYFLLVQTFGGVPLDLGAGELAMNSKPVRTSVRNTVPEVYARCIFPDLEKAIQDLPDNARITGGVTKNVARLYLAKAYLTFGWWLENPGNIPTYPECARSCPNGHDAKWYFQQAYDVAAEGIDNPGQYGLQPSYYKVNVGSNDRNNEVMLYADHTEKDEFYNGASLSWSNGNAPENFAVWMVTWNHPNVVALNENGEKFKPMIRVAEQSSGRPWTRMAPTQEAFTKIFTDKTKDSRYDGTFVTTFRANWSKGGTTAEYAQIGGQQVKEGEPILTILPESNPAVTFPTEDITDFGLGLLEGYKGYVINPEHISRLVYPGLWKLGTYRTDNGTGAGQPNGAITRPFPIAKFSEFYLVAAEAAVKGATTKAGKSARELVNVLRARAGKWEFSVAQDQAVSADYSADLVAETPATIDVDYILLERGREFFGEGYRWFDLARTQKWAEYAGKYTICGSNASDHEAKVYTRTITPKDYLRPIPQGQMDGMEMSQAEKDVYQNPGY